jgi:DNA-binding protein H-NS
MEIRQNFYPMKITDLSSKTIGYLAVLTKKKERLHAKIKEIEKQIELLSAGKENLAKNAVRAQRKRRGTAKPKAGKSAKRAPRGFLKTQITKLTHAAGEAGISAKDLAAKIGKPINHIQVFFSGTGKKLGVFEKLSSGNWRIKKSGAPAAAPANSPS